MTIMWDSTLPQAPSTTSAIGIAPFANNTISTSMENGLPKIRRRFTYMPSSVNCAIRLTSNQVTTLDTFFSNTLNEVDEFQWINFITGANATYIFLTAPTYAYVPDSSPSLWDAQLSLLRKS